MGGLFASETLKRETTTETGEEPDDGDVRRQLPDVADVPPGGEVVW